MVYCRNFPKFARQHCGVVSWIDIAVIPNRRQTLQVYYGLVWFDIVWQGFVRFVWLGIVWKVWYGFVQFGKIWFSMVWFGMVQMSFEFINEHVEILMTVYNGLS